MAKLKIFETKYGLAWVLLILLAINLLASFWHVRLDLTAEKRFTLSEATRNLLSRVDTNLHVQVFLKGNYPSGFKKLSGATEDILHSFKEIAGNHLQYEFISPEEIVEGSSTSYADTISQMGIYPINLTSQVAQGQQQQYVFPAALLHYRGRVLPVLLYQGKTPMINFQELSSAEAMLEYNLANAIAKITQTEKPVIGYAVGNGQPVDHRTYDLVENVLSPNYALYTFDPNIQPMIPLQFDLLMLVKPTIPFSETAKLKLDQYVMNGGKIIWFIDRLNAEMDSLRAGEVIAYDRELNLNDILFKYGVRVNPDLVMDLQCDYLPFDVSGNGQFELLPWNYFPLIGSQNNHPINKNLGFVASRFINSIDTVQAEGIRKTVLLASSANARTISTPALISGRENSIEPENEKFNRAHIPLAVLLEGKFTSLYRNRVSQSIQDTLQKYDLSFLPQSIQENKMIVVSDGDMVLNDVVQGSTPIPMGMNPFTYGTQREFPFANKDFLQNCIDYLINENGLYEAKSKDYILRLLDSNKKEEQRFFWQIVNIGLPVFAILIFAVLFQWIRRRKYAN